MSSPRLEVCLARLYVDEALLERFLRDPDAALSELNLSPEEKEVIKMLDRDDVRDAAASFAKKRGQGGFE